MSQYEAIVNLIFDAHNFLLLVFLYVMGFTMKKTPFIPNSLIAWINGLLGVLIGWIVLPIFRKDLLPVEGLMIGFICAGTSTFGYELLRGLRVWLQDMLEGKNDDPPPPPSTLSGGPIPMIVLGILTLLTGCATPGTIDPKTGAVVPSKAEQVDNFIVQNQAFISLTLALVKQGIVQGTVDDPAERAVLLGKLSGIGSLTRKLVEDGKLEPAEFRAVFKMKEPQYDSQLALIPKAYASLYKISGGNAKLAADTLSAIAEALE